MSDDDFQELKNASFQEAERAASDAHQTVNSAIHDLHSTAKQAHAVNESIRDLREVSAASRVTSAQEGQQVTGEFTDSQAFTPRGVDRIGQTQSVPGSRAFGTNAGRHGSYQTLSHSVRRRVESTDALHSLQRQAGSSAARLHQVSPQSLKYANNLKRLNPTMAKAAAHRLSGVKGSAWAKLPEKALKGTGLTLGKAGVGAVNGAVQYNSSLDPDLGQVENIGEGGLRVGEKTGGTGLKAVRGTVKGIRYAAPRGFHPARSLKEVRLRSSMLRQQAQILRSAGRNLHGLRKVRAIGRAIRKNMESHAILIGGVAGIVVSLLTVLLVTTLLTTMVAGHQSQCENSVSGGGTVKAANFGARSGILPGLKINHKANVRVLDWRGMGIPNHAAYSYDFEQCTWWVAVRLHQLGITPQQYLGDGAVQATNMAKKPGWKLIHFSPYGMRIGDVISFKPDVMDADPVHGHVGVVEKDTDGDPDKAMTSEGGVSFFNNYGGPLMLSHPGLAKTWQTGGIIVARYTGKVDSKSGSTDMTDDPGGVIGCDTGVIAPATSGQKKDEQDYALSQLGKYGWNPDRNGSDFKSLITIWTKESGWNPAAVNPRGGACGIPQALPCSKIPNQKDWHSQIDWGLSYIKSRYGSPTNAWRIWQTQGWY